MKYEFLFFDADNTVLDFDKSEEQALIKAFGECGLEYNYKVLSVYRRNNIHEWERYERGEISRDEVLINRFTETIAELQYPECDHAKLAHIYERELHFGYFTVPHAQEVLEELCKTHKLYIVSNGVLSIQNSRMAGSGFEKYFLKRFISEEIGCPKPQAEFFRRSFCQIEGLDLAKSLVIGDSLTSDIQGGINAGVDTCWFNPEHKANNTSAIPTYEIDDLRKLFEIVE